MPLPFPRSAGRAAAAVSLTLWLAVSLAVPDAVVPAAGAPNCWLPPVVGRVVDPFRPPPCPWCAGNRGIEYGTEPGGPVVAAAPGIVSFAGAVAGTRYVVVGLGDGRRLTYGRLAAISVTAGQPVMTGMRLGTAGALFFFGLRVGDDYHDPGPFLGELRTIARLVPADGAAPRPAPPARLTCDPAR